MSKEEKLKEIVEEIFNHASASDYIKVNNDLLNHFIETCIENTESIYSKKYITEMLHIIGLQTLYLSKMNDIIAK